MVRSKYYEQPQIRSSDVNPATVGVAEDRESPSGSRLGLARVESRGVQSGLASMPEVAATGSARAILLRQASSLLIFFLLSFFLSFSFSSLLPLHSSLFLSHTG